MEQTNIVSLPPPLPLYFSFIVRKAALRNQGKGRKDIEFQRNFALLY